MGIGRMTRRLRRETNELRRPSDRIEAVLTLVLIVATLVLAPWAGRQAARFAHQDVTRANAWQQEHRFRVDAVLIEPVPPAPPGDAGDAATAGGPALARWTALDGSVHTGTVFLRSNRPAGATVPLWIDDRGQATGPPARRDPGAAAGIAALLSVCAVTAGVAGLHRILRWRLDRRRLRAWQAEWAVVEPVWTSRH